MSVHLFIQVHSGLYLRDPQQTALGKKIIRESVLLMDEIGFEQFTFRKLADRIYSSEASIYRYFENKHLMLTYLLCWYWELLAFRMEMSTMNISNPKEKMGKVLSCLVHKSPAESLQEIMDVGALHRISAAEGIKVYHTKAIDKEHAMGYFSSYERLVDKIHVIIREINPSFPFPHALATNLIEMATNHSYFAEHLPGLTDVDRHQDYPAKLYEMLLFFAFQLLDVRD